ncbi:uncharacterized protein LOC117330783 isoform X3 [Pecten maximus]|uniref:uncharacterized protein LOC117330783 isoform X3 n=1 Tax=Pecten maximus TaxID=6579 RepID=UPI001458D190|nr:uncharacterized protein LOC117330783 isoform X3 [Pecten maximus]
MVLPTTLKKRHTLKGRNVLPAVRRLQEGAPVKALARMMAGRKTDDLSIRDVEKYVNELTDESLSDLLELAGKNKEDISEARLLLHYLIVLANEKGQPQGQDLLEAPGTSTEAQDDITQGQNLGPAHWRQELRFWKAPHHQRFPTLKRGGAERMAAVMVELQKKTKKKQKKTKKQT